MLIRMAGSVLGVFFKGVLIVLCSLGVILMVAGIGVAVVQPVLDVFVGVGLVALLASPGSFFVLIQAKVVRAGGVPDYLGAVAVILNVFVFKIVQMLLVILPFLEFFSLS